MISSILSNAWGFLSKSDPNTEQLRLIRRALTGGTAFSRGFQPALDPAGASPPGAPYSPLFKLTKREMSTVIGLSKGLTNRQIAQDLGLKEQTVKNVVSNALSKLELAGRTQIAVLVTTSRNAAPVTTPASYRNHGSPKLVSQVTSALLACTREGQTPLDDASRSRAARTLARALASIQGQS